ncbi:Antitoxin [Corynebacterium kalinowskii]|uniref:Antitoxin n=1 Tax=Corynebacterium kalinowskii TaxID=2675216 RepID=A0A6B8VNF0_9CORY|nr:antitoxin [Corynebacterium kalinowskii]QGU01057.1 Antitoxin [Corynebacterium kalinowskii]
MSIFDKAKDFAEKNPDQVDGLIEKAGDLIDAKTEGKFADKVNQAQELAKDKLRGEKAGAPAEAPTEAPAPGEAPVMDETPVENPVDEPNVTPAPEM